MIALSPDAIIGGLINGFCLGGTYILIGLGLTLILSIMNIMQFAHGEIYMLGAYAVYYLTVMNEVPIYAAIIISMVVTGLIGLILERFLLRPLKGKLLSYVCATTGLGLILQTVMVLGFSLALKQLPSLWPGTWDLSGIFISKERFAAVLIALVMCVGLYLFLKQSKYGLAIVASAQSRDGALMQGINPNLMSALVVCIGSAFAAVGGALGGGIFNVDPYMGGTAFIKGMTLIILGGLGSIGGAVIGGLILGISEAIIGMFFGSQMVVIIPLILVIAILIFRPKGLFGHD
jgi:branched-chain amino acid transport system permease protein